MWPCNQATPRKPQEQVTTFRANSQKERGSVCEKKERGAPCRVWSRGAENNPAAAVQATMDACTLYSSQDKFGRVNIAGVFHTTGCRLNVLLW